MEVQSDSSPVKENAHSSPDGELDASNADAEIFLNNEPIEETPPPAIPPNTAEVTTDLSHEPNRSATLLQAVDPRGIKESYYI
jgi:hypothetical protein